MLKTLSEPGRLSCFSPPVMIATSFIEIIAALYVVYRYKLNPVTRLASLILVCLAVFQMAEYNVCEGAFGISSLDWSRVGYVAITLLPPLGIHLAYTIAGRINRVVVAAVYTFATFFSLFFLTVGHGIATSQCTGNYVIFSTAPGVSILYGFYYYSLLIVGIMISLQQASRVKSRRIASTLYWLITGYLVFMVPAIAVHFISKTTLSAMPSIMCGFAVFLALVLTLYVVPTYMKDAKK